jgi:hypothetical protein
MNQPRIGSRLINFPFATALLTCTALLAIVAWFPSPSRAQDDQPSAQDNGQPARAIRLSDVHGKVQLSEGGQVTAQQAVVNTPLVQGMTIATADDGRAEIQFEDGSVVRVAPNSSLTLAVLSGSGSTGNAEMDLDHGLAYFELQGTGQTGQMSIHFGNNVITASGFTVLRITDDNPPGDLAVFSGNAHVDRGSGSALDLHGGESVSFTSSDPGGYVLADNIESNSWDSWNSDRDQALAAEASTQTNAPSDLAPGDTSNPAWSDLDSNGTWYNVPGQGYVWSPYDASNAGFDPYGNGNWVWTPGFGYTWASAYNWGYMPYSCGAWNFYGGFGWGWAPGMGGCSPWWGTGFYGGPAIGYAPSWYRPVQRPNGPGSTGGIGHGLGPIHDPVRGRPIPVITVHRQPPVLSAGLPPRDHNLPVSIDGQKVFGLRPVSHPVYGNSIFAGRPVAGALPARPGLGDGRAIYTPMRPIYSPHPLQPLGGSMAQPPGRAYGPPSNRGWNSPGQGSMRTYSPTPGHSSRGSSGGGAGGYHGSSAGGGGSHGGSVAGGGGFHGGGGGGGGGFHGGGGGGGGSHGGGGGGGGGGHR